MPRFYFQLDNHIGKQRDDTGRQFASPDQAVTEASRSAAEILRDDLIDGHSSATVKVTVTDENGGEVALVETSGRVTRR